MSYPLERRIQGITGGDLGRDYPKQFGNAASVTAALDLLREEGKLRDERTGGHRDSRDVIKVYPPVEIQIPPRQEAFLRECHQVGDHELVIDFYRDVEGKVFVWPYVGRVRQYSASHRHFPLWGHFDDVEAARESALNQGRMLVEIGFDLDHFES
ncbi:MAG: hypothetical protein WA252_20855 [Candidatus Sulfotelmatobacter sp.]